MPYHSQRKLLFIHIPKNGGKSVEIALGLASSADTEHYRWRTPLNRALTWAQRRTSDPQTRGRLWGVLDHTLNAAHLTYAEIYLLGLIPPAELSQCAKVTVCRNPYDRAVSLFYHLAPDAERSPRAFEEFLRTWVNAFSQKHSELSFIRQQWEFCVDLKGRLIIDHVLRYERLAEDFGALSEQVLGAPVDLPWVGRQRRDRDYSSLYTAEARRLVRNAYAEDLEMFGYDY